MTKRKRQAVDQPGAAKRTKAKAPRHPYTPKPTLTSLPDELLLQIGAEISCGPVSKWRVRQQDLSNFSQICRGTRGPAVECLLKHAVLDRFQARSFLRMLLSFPDAARRARTLEIKAPYRRKVPSLKPDDQLLETTKEFIAQYASATVNKELWLQEFNKGVKEAIMGVMFATLPGLKDLRLGQGQLQYHAILNCVFVPPTEDIPWRRPAPWAKAQSYLDPIFAQTAARLESLDLPMDWEFKRKNRPHSLYVWRYDSAQLPSYTVLDMTAFSSLRHLAIAQHALYREGFLPIISRNLTMDASLVSLHAVFPRTLETLTVGNVNMVGRSFQYMLLVTEFQPSFPALKRLHLHYKWGPHTHIHFRTFIPELLAQATAKLHSRGVTLEETYFLDDMAAPDAMELEGQPWRYTVADGVGLAKSMSRPVHM